jgi:hypothetical protein
MRRLLAIALCATATASAQDRPVVLTLPGGTQALGVGDAFVAGRGPEVIFYNPAHLAMQPGMAASVQRYGSASTGTSFASVMALPGSAVGIGVQYLEFSDGATLGQRGTVNASSLAASFALNPPAFKTIRSGVTVKYVEERIGATRDGGVAVDAGLSRDFFGRATLAIVAQNIGGGINVSGAEAGLPVRYVLGGAFRAPPFLTYFDATAVASIGYLRDGTAVPAAGIELGYVPLDGWAVTLRAGARRVVDLSDAGTFTLGAGLSLDRVSLDYAYHPMGNVGASHRMGFRIR